MVLPVREAVMCYLRRGKQTLFIDYTKGGHPIHVGKFSPSGGKLDPGETPEAAASREVLEETGIITRSLTYRGKVLFKNELRTINGKPMTHDWLVHLYDCHDFDDSQARATEGELAWINNSKVPEVQMHEGDQLIWNKWLTQHSFFEGEIVHEGERLTGSRLISN